MKFAPLGLLTLGLLLLTNPPASAQEREDLPKWKIDPYTENEPERYQAAGYERYHRVMVTNNLSATEVQQALGDLEMIWVETEHFVIGSTLPDYKIPGDKIQKERIHGELDRLREKLPTIPVSKKVKKLDRWLRVHLYAQRCEDLYSRMEELLGVDEDSFPAGPNQRIQGEYRGEGPYLGQKGKYVILLTKQKSTLHRFATTWCDSNFQADSPIVHNFFSEWVMLYGTSPELAEGYLSDDARLHANLLHGIVHCTLAGYKGYMHDLPVWLREGIAHCIGIEIEPRYHNFLKIKDAFPNEKKLWIWEPRVRNLVKNEAALTFTKVSGWIEAKEFRIGDHLNMWSRVDYLMKKDPERLASFIAKLKDPIKVPDGGYVSVDQVRERQAEAWKLVYNMDFASFDEEWSEWVLDNYKKK